MAPLLKNIYNQIFQHLNKFLGTDASYIARGSFWLSIGSFIGMGTAFLLSIAYARFIPKDVYGDYRYILSAINMAGIFALSGVGTVIVRSAARGFDSTFLKGAKLMFFTSLIITLAGLATSTVYFAKGNAALGWGFLAAAFFVPFIEGLGNWRGYLDAKREFKKKTYYNFLAQLFYGVVMLLTIYIIYTYGLSHYTSVGLLVGTYFTTHALPNLIFFYRAKKLVPPHAPEEPGAIRYGIHLSLSNVPSTVATYLDGVLLYQLLGSEALAIYSFAIALPEQIKAILGNTVTVVFPKLSRYTGNSKERNELKRTLPRKVFKATALTTLIVIAYIVAAPLIYSVLFPRYTDSINFSRLFALSLVLFPFGVFGTALKAEGNMRKIYIFNTASPVIQIILLIALTPAFGLWGTVTARVLGRVVNYALEFFLFAR